MWDLDKPLKVTQNRSGSQGCDGNMLAAVHDQSVINLIGKDDQMVLTRDFHDSSRTSFG